MNAPSDLVVMGYVSGVFGVRGWLKIRPETDDPEALFDYSVWWLGREGAWRAYEFINGQVQPKAVIASLKGVHDRDAAALLKGSLIAIPRELLPETEDDEFYWNDLIGLQVQNLQGQHFGRVVRLLETGAHDVLVIQNDVDASEILIPFVSVYVSEVRLQDALIVVDWQADY